MSNCRVCSAEITWVETPDGERIPLDDRETALEGEGRWRITAYSDPPKVEAVAPEYPVPAQVDHRQICQQPRAI